MAQQDTIKERERFQAALQDAASNQAIPLDRLSWRDIPNRDASDLLSRRAAKREFLRSPRAIWSMILKDRLIRFLMSPLMWSRQNA